jgi:ABC-type branched-subunit amino acid transport system substrate-binding protein
MIGRTRWFGVAACTAVLALAAPAAAGVGASTSPRGDAGTIRIDVMDSFTGPSATNCYDEFRAADLALAEAQHRKETITTQVGGKTVARKVPYLRGVAIKLVQQDDQSVAAPGVLGFRAAADSNAVAMTGPCSSVPALAIYQLIDAAKLPWVITTAGLPELVGPKYAFRAGIAPQFYAASEMQVLAGLGKKTVFILHQDDNPTLGNFWKALGRAANVLGIKVVGDYSVTNTTADYTPAIQQIQKLNPDAVGVIVTGAKTLPATTQLRNGGISQTLFGQQGMLNPNFLGAASAVNGTVIGSNYAPNFPYKSSVLYTKEFIAKYESTPTGTSAAGYDAMWRVLKAIHDAGPTKVAKATTANARELVRAQLAAQKSFIGAQGPLTYTSEGDVKGPCGVIQISDDKGTLKFLKIPSVKSLKK